jgi:Glyoxalase-like domain
VNTNFSFDHGTVAVSNLTVAIQSFTEMGFIVTPGGIHQHGLTQNALIPFADGSYLELLALRRHALKAFVERLEHVGAMNTLSSNTARRFLTRYGQGRGLADFALSTKTLDRTLNVARTHGLLIDRPARTGRTPTDGKVLGWKLGVPITFDLPFLIEDITSRSHRIPDSATRDHPNGVTGIANLVVVVRHLSKTAWRYRTLGLEPTPLATPSIPDRHQLQIVLTPTTITLAEPTCKESELYHHLSARGEGPYLIQLRATQPASTKTLELSRAYNVRMEFLSEDSP